MISTKSSLGIYSDLIDFALQALPPAHPTGQLEYRVVRKMLGIEHEAVPISPAIEAEWNRDGVHGFEVSWSVGYGPRTYAWLLRPEGTQGPLPGVVALHGHDALKFYGKEKIAIGKDDPDDDMIAVRKEFYQGRAFANELARNGFTVLCPDVFMWGSRRFPLTQINSARKLTPGETWITPEIYYADRDDTAWYNRAAARHENTVAKYCAALGISLSGIVAYEDRVAVNYLRSRGDLVAESIGCIGMSGGGCRAALLNATSSTIDATVIIGMMSTRRDLLDHHVGDHTWMFFPPELPAIGDWPDLAACRAPAPLLVQYLMGDRLFPYSGMRSAHERLGQIYREAQHPDNYVSEFYEGPHRFDIEMQDSAFSFLADRLTAIL